jgi:hypothetical protein
MPLRDVLLEHGEASPGWLNQDNPPPLAQATFASFLASRVVYYPGSGTDGHALALFGGTRSAHCFIHCDYGIDLEDAIRVPYPAGYREVLSQPLNAMETQELICKEPIDNCGLDVHAAGAEPNSEGAIRVCFPKNPRSRTRGPEWPGSKLAGAYWVILQRQEDLDAAHVPRRIALLHIHAEAMWVYCQVWARRRIAPYAIVLQDHGFGGSWCNFGSQGSPLLSMAQQAGLPEWLLVADNTDPWPGYQQASEDAEPGGQHGHPRRLYRLYRPPAPQGVA